MICFTLFLIFWSQNKRNKNSTIKSDTKNPYHIKQWQTFFSHSVAPPPPLQTSSTDTRALIHDTQHTSHKTQAVSTVYKKEKLTLATDSKCSWLFCKALALCNVFPMEVFFLRNTSPWLFSQSMTCCENKMSCQSHRIRPYWSLCTGFVGISRHNDYNIHSSLLY